MAVASPLSTDAGTELFDFTNFISRLDKQPITRKEYFFLIFSKNQKNLTNSRVLAFSHLFHETLSNPEKIATKQSTTAQSNHRETRHRLHRGAFIPAAVYHGTLHQQRLQTKTSPAKATAH